MRKTLLNKICWCAESYHLIKRYDVLLRKCTKGRVRKTLKCTFSLYVELQKVRLDHLLSTACHFSKWVKSKNKSSNGFPGQRGLYRVQKYQLEKNWSGKFWVLRNLQVSRRGKNWVNTASCWIWRPYCAVLSGRS